jgi:hypothetical protein
MNTNNKLKSSIDFKKIETFLSKVINKNILPNAEFASAFALIPYESKYYNSIKLNLTTTFSNYLNSNYFFDGTYKFIHFTSIKNLLSIIREKKLRMYSLNSMDDKYEFDFAHKIFNSNMPETVKDIKDNTFCFSMCKYELETKEQSLNIWRSFGLDGYGVGIVLKFNKKTRYNWNDFILSQIYYGEKYLKKIKKACKDYSEFSTKNNFYINNFYNIFYTLLCFHKNHIYKGEKEVRLIYNNNFNILNNQYHKLDLNGKNKLISYKELDLEWDNSQLFKNSNQKLIKEAKTIHPYITIDKIIFGYRISTNDKFNIIDALSPNKLNYKSFPIYKDSFLQKYF